MVTAPLSKETRGLIEGERIAKASVLTLLGIGIMELAFSQYSGSIALFADGVDSLSDAAVSFFVWTGLRFARRPPSRSFPYGYYKVESLVSLLTAIGLVAVGAFALMQSFTAFLDPKPVGLPVVALLALIVAGSVALYRALQMNRISNRYGILSLKMDARNSIKDASASFIAFGSVLVSTFGFHQMDSVGGMLVSIYILTVAYVALKEASLVLLDAFHEPGITSEIESIVKSNLHIKGVNELRLRRAGPFIVGAIEVIIDEDMTVRQMHLITSELEASIKSRIPGIRRLTVRAVPHSYPHLD